MKTGKFLSKLNKRTRRRVVSLIRKLPPAWLIERIYQIQNMQSLNVLIEYEGRESCELGDLQEDKSHQDRFTRLKALLLASVTMPKQRALIECLAEGEQPQDIARKWKVTLSSVTDMLYRVRKSIRAEWTARDLRWVIRSHREVCWAKAADPFDSYL